MNELFNEITIWEEFLQHEQKKQEAFKDKALMNRITNIILRLQKKYFTVDETNFLNTKVIHKKIQKHLGDKPRDVYFFEEPYQTFLKFINFWILSQPAITSGLSYRSLAYNKGGDYKVKKAVEEIHKHTQRSNLNNKLWYFKTDITNFFNSIPLDLLFDELKLFFNKQQITELRDGIKVVDLLAFFGNVLHDSFDSGICKIAGMPIAGFLSNVFLNEIDHAINNFNDGSLLEDLGKINYYRYADDILMTSFDPRSIVLNELTLNKMLEERKLKLSEKKTISGFMGDKKEFVFLGLRIEKSGIDIAKKSEDKIKKSMRRRAKWFSYKLDKKRFNSNQNVMKMYIHGINAKLFTRDNEDGTCWLEWYGNRITTTDTLKRIETYYIDQLQYLNKNKRDYTLFKKLGYKSLINEYFKNKTWL